MVLRNFYIIQYKLLFDKIIKQRTQFNSLRSQGLYLYINLILFLSVTGRVKWASQRPYLTYIRSSTSCGGATPLVDPLTMVFVRTEFIKNYVTIRRISYITLYNVGT